MPRAPARAQPNSQQRARVACTRSAGLSHRLRRATWKPNTHTHAHTQVKWDYVAFCAYTASTWLVVYKAMQGAGDSPWIYAHPKARALPTDD